jgi:hypothetical protein
LEDDRIEEPFSCVGTDSTHKPTLLNGNTVAVLKRIDYEYIVLDFASGKPRREIGVKTLHIYD